MEDRIIEKRFAIGLVVAGIFAVVSLPSWAENKEEEKVAVTQVPASVKSTIEQQAKGGTLREIDKRTADGKTVYAARITANGNDREIVIGEDGKLIYRGAVAKEDEDDDD